MAKGHIKEFHLSKEYTTLTPGGRDGMGREWELHGRGPYTGKMREARSS
jgi:hypothetical protein